MVGVAAAVVVCHDWRDDVTSGGPASTSVSEVGPIETVAIVGLEGLAEVGVLAAIRDFWFFGMQPSSGSTKSGPWEIFATNPEGFKEAWEGPSAKIDWLAGDLVVATA